MSLLTELDRRNVVRVGVAYVVAAWVVAQVADLVLDNIGAPAWVIQTLFAGLAIGFVAAVIIAWAYEVTPEGIKRESEITRNNPITHQTAKKLDYITIGLLVLAIGLFFIDRLLPEGVRTSPAASTVENSASASPTSTDDAVIPASDKSIAVLPFIALTPEEDDAYFGKGIAEELLNALAQFPNLKVAARTSAFSFAAEDRDLREVGAALNVAHVLEGSVQRSGDRIRITAQLIRAEDGFHLWSGSYERRFADLFDIQDEIVTELSRILQIRLGVGAGAGRAGNHKVNPEAYETYLRGLDYWWTREDLKNRAAAVQAFLRATELDPNFPDGWAAYAVSMAFSDVDMAPHLKPEDVNAAIASAFARSLDLDPTNPRALAGLVYWHLTRQIDIPAANGYLVRALDAAPNYGFTNYAAANFHFAVGNEREATAALNRAIAADPLNTTLQRMRFQHDSAFGNFDATSPFLEGIAQCIPTGCKPVDWLHAWRALVAALHASDQDDIRRMREMFDSVHSALDVQLDLIDVNHEFLVKFADTVLGEDLHADYWNETDFVADAFIGTYIFDASILAQRGRDEQALEILETVTRSGRFFASRGITYILWPGRFEIPERIRKDRRYHELWTLPGMSELALARRANGQSAGLPILAGAE